VATTTIVAIRRRPRGLRPAGCQSARALRPPRGPPVVPPSPSWSRCVRAAAQTEIPVLVGARLAAHLSLPSAVWCKQVRAHSLTADDCARTEGDNSASEDGCFLGAHSASCVFLMAIPCSFLPPHSDCATSPRSHQLVGTTQHAMMVQ
jgi:hypothetical protein